MNFITNFFSSPPRKNPILFDETYQDELLDLEELSGLIQLEEEEVPIKTFELKAPLNLEGVRVISNLNSTERVTSETFLKYLDYLAEKKGILIERGMLTNEGFDVYDLPLGKDLIFIPLILQPIDEFTQEQMATIVIRPKQKEVYYFDPSGKSGKNETRKIAGGIPLDTYLKHLAKGLGNYSTISSKNSFQTDEVDSALYVLHFIESQHEKKYAPLENIEKYKEQIAIDLRYHYFPPKGLDDTTTKRERIHFLNDVKEQSEQWRATNLIKDTSYFYREKGKLNPKIDCESIFNQCDSDIQRGTKDLSNKEEPKDIGSHFFDGKRIYSPEQLSHAIRKNFTQDDKKLYEIMSLFQQGVFAGFLSKIYNTFKIKYLNESDYCVKDTAYTGNFNPMRFSANSQTKTLYFSKYFTLFQNSTGKEVALLHCQIGVDLEENTAIESWKVDKILVTEDK